MICLLSEIVKFRPVCTLIFMKNKINRLDFHFWHGFLFVFLRRKKQKH